MGRLIKREIIEEPIKITESQPEDLLEPKYELCNTCKVGRYIPTGDPEYFKCTICYGRKMVPRLWFSNDKPNTQTYITEG
jgi:hypothetical protein